MLVLIFGVGITLGMCSLPMSDIDRTPDTYPQQPQPRTFKAKVVAEFVDAIPVPADHFRKYKTSWQPQDGLKEGLEKAFRNPGRAMLLVTYEEAKDSPSKRREMARLRAKSLGDQGYSERMGWTVRNVDERVYVMFNPPAEGY